MELDTLPFNITPYVKDFHAIESLLEREEDGLFSEQYKYSLPLYLITMLIKKSFDDDLFSDTFNNACQKLLDLVQRDVYSQAKTKDLSTLVDCAIYYNVLIGKRILNQLGTIDFAPSYKNWLLIVCHLGSSTNFFNIIIESQFSSLYLGSYVDFLLNVRYNRYKEIRLLKLETLEALDKLNVISGNEEFSKFNLVKYMLKWKPSLDDVDLLYKIFATPMFRDELLRNELLVQKLYRHYINDPFDYDEDDEEAFLAFSKVIYHITELDTIKKLDVSIPVRRFMWLLSNNVNIEEYNLKYLYYSIVSLSNIHKLGMGEFTNRRIPSQLLLKKSASSKTMYSPRVVAHITNMISILENQSNSTHPFIASLLDDPRFNTILRELKALRNALDVL